MPVTKIVVIGAGSASFGLSTLATIMRSQALRGSTLGLVDINRQGLETMSTLGARMNREWDSQIAIESSTERSDLLPGADFVILSIEPGPREQLWRQDWEIPLRHGLRQPYAENGGPGGFAHTARNIPVVLGVAQDMERLCPEAWLVNFTNPVPRLCLAATRHTRIKTVGLCHQLHVAYLIAFAVLAERWGIQLPPDLDSHPDPKSTRDTGRWVDLAHEKLDVKAVGLNHFIWIVDIRDKASGEDLYPLFRQQYRTYSPGFEPLTRKMFEVFGLCPGPGDCHLSEYLPWGHDPQTKPWETYNLRLYDWEAAEKERQDRARLAAAMATGEQPIDRLLQVRSEGAVELIEAVAGDTNAYIPTVNIPNQGYIPNLPDGTIVEVPAVADGMGIHGLGLDPLPEAIAELCRREAALARLVVDAAATGNRELALQALLLDPMISDFGQAEGILNDYLEAYAEWLPQFQNEAMRQRGSETGCWLNQLVSRDQGLGSRRD
jgi:alpha-galactosidase